jgi:ubiquinone/menaquinone biosynthesis C-methylase UbiE
VSIAHRQDEAPARSGWQLEETSAEAYERYAVPSWSRPLARQLVELAAPGPRERVLDVACGTGIVARLAAQLVGERGAVCGLDVNEGMLEVARVASAKVSPPIEWRQGDAQATALPDAAFDLVLCQQGLQFFARRAAALREMHRVLAPGGRLALSVLRPVAYNRGWGILLAGALQRHAGPEAGAMMRSPFAEGDAAELRELVTSAGFHNVSVRIVIATARYPSPTELVRWEAAASPLAGPIGALGEDARAALSADVAAAVREYTDDAGVVFPTETYVVLARRGHGEGPHGTPSPTALGGTDDR